MNEQELSPEYVAEQRSAETARAVARMRNLRDRWYRAVAERDSARHVCAAAERREKSERDAFEAAQIEVAACAMAEHPEIGIATNACSMAESPAR